MQHSVDLKKIAFYEFLPIAIFKISAIFTLKQSSERPGRASCFVVRCASGPLSGLLSY
jgi:hypothetical protein